MINKRAFVIILDGVGIGELPDASQYADEGSDTLGNLARVSGGLELPNLAQLGLGCIHPIDGVSCSEEIIGNYGKMAEISAGKDSTTGHWELAGIISEKPFPTYPKGFPQPVIDEFEKRTGYGVLGNCVASGTEIIKELGEEHLRTGKPIIYTSADSVFQIAAHEEKIPLKELYRICEISREFLHSENEVGRVIARPFSGKDRESFQRTKNRKDFSLMPRGKTILRRLYEKNIPTVGIGKISDLYAYDGLSENIITKTNVEGMSALKASIKKNPSGLIMANLVDFDMLFGHRNDVNGFYGCLSEFDEWLADFLRQIGENDILFITADHGNDPTTPGTDHSREYVPLLLYGKSIKQGVNLGVRKTFSDLNATLAGYFSVESGNCGESFWPLVCK